MKLDSVAMVLKGGDSGPALVPGKPDESLLVSAIKYDDLEMPPDEPLSARELKLIDQWIRRGAHWPKSDDVDGADSTDTEPAYDKSDWWAAKPITSIPPRPIDGTHSPSKIDQYIDAKLSDHNLHRAPPASRDRLIRRLSFDLLGVPPTIEQIERFQIDDSPDAYERLVDRMFADPRYGERMARLWMDLVRYADSDGWRQDAYRPGMWRYRQWVANAFNSGLPYDQFVAMQLAADEIAPGDPDSAAAVGFFRLGIYEYNQRNAEGQWQDIVDELTDVTADVFLATGIACAKCHDHKFDPIPRGDYFRFRSVFEPVQFIDKIEHKKDLTDLQREKVAELKKQLNELEGKALDELGGGAVEKFPVHVQAMFRKSPSERTSYENQISYMVGRQVFEEGATPAKVEKKIGKDSAAQRAKVLKELDQFGANPYATVTHMTVQDWAGKIRPTRLPGRTTGQAFSPAAPSLFDKHDLNPAPPNESPQSTGRRTALARWITSPENPIASRVIVNRLWQYHFGTGLVDSPNDFGKLGSHPSHPHLLDALAGQLIDSGWDLQAMQRSMVGSAAYRQSALHDDSDAAMQLDSANRLLWHRSVRRLDAEQYRDALLIAMGSLDSTYGGPSVAGTPARRTIYLRRMRNSADEMLHLLDSPPGVVGTSKRDVTVTAPQSLMMINSKRLLNVAKTFAARVRRDIDAQSPSDPHAEFVRHAHRIITGQSPDDSIVEWMHGQSDTDICHILLNSNAFLFVD